MNHQPKRQRCHTCERFASTHSGTRSSLTGSHRRQSCTQEKFKAELLHSKKESRLHAIFTAPKIFQSSALRLQIKKVTCVLESRFENSSFLKPRVDCRLPDASQVSRLLASMRGGRGFGNKAGFSLSRTFIKAIVRPRSEKRAQAR